MEETTVAAFIARKMNGSLGPVEVGPWICTYIPIANCIKRERIFRFSPVYTSTDLAMLPNSNKTDYLYL